MFVTAILAIMAPMYFGIDDVPDINYPTLNITASGAPVIICLHQGKINVEIDGTSIDYNRLRIKYSGQVMDLSVEEGRLWFRTLAIRLDNKVTKVISIMHLQGTLTLRAKDPKEWGRAAQPSIVPASPIRTTTEPPPSPVPR